MSELSLLILSVPLIQIGYTPQTVRETAFFTENINDEKSSFYLFFVILCVFFCSAEETIRIENEELMKLSDLNGIWENDSRFLVFNTDTISFVLKPFYRFYYDETDTLRAGLTTGETGETVLRVKYSNQKKTLPHPICVINDKLFLA